MAGSQYLGLEQDRAGHEDAALRDPEFPEPVLDRQCRRLSQAVPLQLRFAFADKPHLTRTRQERLAVGRRARQPEVPGCATAAPERRRTPRT